MTQTFEGWLDTYKTAKETLKTAENGIRVELEVKINNLCKSFFGKDVKDCPEMFFRFSVEDCKIEFVEDFGYNVWVQVFCLRRNSGYHEDLAYYTEYAGMSPVKFKKNSS